MHMAPPGPAGRAGGAHGVGDEGSATEEEASGLRAVPVDAEQTCSTVKQEARGSNAAREALVEASYALGLTSLILEPSAGAVAPMCLSTSQASLVVTSPLCAGPPPGDPCRDLPVAPVTFGTRGASFSLAALYRQQGWLYTRQGPRGRGSKAGSSPVP